MNGLVNYSKAFIRRNASTILTSLGAGGVILTTVSAVKATPKALLYLEEATEEKGEKLTALEMIQAAGPVYIPAALIGVSTIACIFGANFLNQRHQASLMSAYALIDTSYKDYKNKVNELYGEDASNTVQTEIAKDKYNEADIVIDDGKQLYYDMFSNRYFESTPEEVVKAEYKMATAVLVNSGDSVNVYYDALGLPHEEAYDELGWAWATNEEMYWSAWAEFEKEVVEMEDGLECTIIRMPFEPVVDFGYY